MMETPEPTRSIAPQLVMGLLIIVIGVLFTLENVGLLDAHDYLRFWPVGLVAIGLVKLWQGGGGGAGSGFVFVFAGVWLLLESMGIVTISLWNLWPMLFVFVGGAMVWRGLFGRPAQGAPADSHSTVSAMAVLAGVNRRSNSKTFRGGDLTAVMGGCQIDLRQATMEGEAVIDVFAMWGGIEIKVPENWSVSGRVTPILGGYRGQDAPGARGHQPAAARARLRDHGRRRNQELTPADASDPGARQPPCAVSRASGRSSACCWPRCSLARAALRATRALGDRRSAGARVRVLLPLRVVRFAQHAARADRRRPSGRDCSDVLDHFERPVAGSCTRLARAPCARERTGIGRCVRGGAHAAVRLRRAALPAFPCGQLPAGRVRTLARGGAERPGGAGARPRGGTAIAAHPDRSAFSVQQPALDQRAHHRAIRRRHGACACCSAIFFATAWRLDRRIALRSPGSCSWPSAFWKSNGSDLAIGCK